MSYHDCHAMDDSFCFICIFAHMKDCGVWVLQLQHVEVMLGDLNVCWNWSCVVCVLQSCRLKVTCTQSEWLLL